MTSQAMNIAWIRTFVKELEKFAQATSFGLPPDLLDVQVKLIDKTLNVGQKIEQCGGFRRD